MEKTKLSDEQLQKVINLRKSGGKWLQIEKAMGVGRAIIKREYEAWEHKQALGELKEARIVVAAEAFREHINYLVQVAEMLVNHLWGPTENDRDITADKFLDQIWGDNVVPKNYLASTGLNIRQNRMLFQSLKTHTQDKVQWQDMDEWRGEWNGCIGHITILRQEALKMVNTFLAREESTYPGLAANIKKHTKQERPYEKMAGAIVKELLWRLEHSQSDLGHPVTKIYSQGSECQLSLYSSSMTVLNFSDNDIISSKAANRACNAVAKELFKDHEKDSIALLRQSISKLSTLRERFEELLDPLILRPMILRTRCDLCPA